MGERYVTEARFLVAQYEGLPLPGDLVEGWVVHEVVDGTADPDEAVRLVEDELVRVGRVGESVTEPFTLDERWSRMSWGADASILTIILGVATTFGGVAGIVYLLEKFATGLRNPNTGTAMYDANTAPSVARENLAVFLNRSGSEIKIIEVRPKGSRFEIELAAPEGSFLMKVEGGKPHHLRRLSQSS